MKYNLSKIMKAAWSYVKTEGMNISSALKRAWKEAKNMMNNTKNTLIAKLHAMVNEFNSRDNGFHQEAVVSDWANYGKSRTYFSIRETRRNSKHNVVKRFGYFDNISNEYVPEKYGVIK